LPFTQARWSGPCHCSFPGGLTQPAHRPSPASGSPDLIGLGKSWAKHATIISTLSRMHSTNSSNGNPHASITHAGRMRWAGDEGGQLPIGKDKLPLRAILTIFKRPNRPAHPVAPIHLCSSIVAPYGKSQLICLDDVLFLCINVCSCVLVYRRNGFWK
jgi:hypothetical protein